MLQLSTERAERIFQEMKRVRIAVIGDLMLDRYLWGNVERISPEAPVPIVDYKGESANLGGAANVAANVGALGAEVLLFGVVGEDLEAGQLRDLILKNRFGDSGVVAVPNRPTSVKTRIIANNQHVVRIDREAVEELDSDIQRELLFRFQQALEGMNGVILEDYNKGVLTPSLIQEIIRACHQARVPIGVDPKHQNFWAYKGATLFKPNLKEIEGALGRQLRNDEALTRGGEELMEQLALKYLLVTRGEHGMALFHNRKVDFIPTRAQRVHDVSGAGDTVIATALTALAGGATIAEAALMANHAAGIVIAEVGAVPVDAEELRRACLRNAEL